MLKKLSRFLVSIRFRLLFFSIVTLAAAFYVLISMTIVEGEKQIRRTHERTEQEIKDATKRWSTLLNRVAFGSMRESMAKYDIEGMDKIVKMIRRQTGVQAVRVYRPAGKMAFNGDTQETGVQVDLLDCKACHAQSLRVTDVKAEMVDAQSSINAKITNDKAGSRTFLLVTHIYNQEDPCWQCHGSSNKVNGILQMNFSLKEMDEKLAELKEKMLATLAEYRRKALFWGWTLFFVGGVIITAIATAIVNKLAKFKTVAEKVSMGETTVSIDDIPPSLDEIGELRDAFGRMLVAVRFFMLPEEKEEEVL